VGISKKLATPYLEVKWGFKARFGFRLSFPGNQEAPIQAKIAIIKKKIHSNSLITPFGMLEAAAMRICILHRLSCNVPNY
jgi:hypothetical protein